LNQCVSIDESDSQESNLWAKAIESNSKVSNELLWLSRLGGSQKKTIPLS